MVWMFVLLPAPNNIHVVKLRPVVTVLEMEPWQVTRSSGQNLYEQDYCPLKEGQGSPCGGLSRYPPSALEREVFKKNSGIPHEGPRRLHHVTKMEAHVGPAGGGQDREAMRTSGG